MKYFKRENAESKIQFVVPLNTTLHALPCHDLNTDVSLNPLTPNDLYRRRAVSPLKIKIPSKNSRQAALRGGI
jgi:hypothetical protein